MSKLYKVLLLLLVTFFYKNPIKAEIIKNEDITTQKFGIWTVSCREDQMLDKIECKLFAEINDQSIIFLNPLNKENMITIVSKDIQNNTKMLIKVDKNPLFISLEYKNNEFGYVEFLLDDKINIFKNIKNGEALFFRFSTIDSKEITVKLSLKDLQKALDYFNTKTIIKDTNPVEAKSENGVVDLDKKPTVNLKENKTKK